MICTVKFNPEKDIQEVDQVGFLDLRKAWETHTVVGNFDLDDMLFNGIEDAEAVLISPRNIFEGVELGQAIAANLDRANADNQSSK